MKSVVLDHQKRLRMIKKGLIYTLKGYKDVFGPNYTHYFAKKKCQIWGTLGMPPFVEKIRQIVLKGSLVAHNLKV